MAEEGAVSYTTKELLSRIEEKVDRIDEKLDSKADRDRLHTLGNHITQLESRFTLLESQVVRRDGPLMQRLDGFEKAVAELTSQMLTKREVDQALVQQEARQQRRTDRVLSRANIGFALVVSVIVIANFLAARLVS